MKTILFYILDKYADHEGAYLALIASFLGKNEYEIKTVSLNKEAVSSIGGFKTLPDYDIKTAPKDFSGLVLIGGLSLRTEEAKQIKPLVDIAVKNKKVLGGICDAAGFLGVLGVLNDVNHTCNDLDDVKLWAKEAYTGEAKYIKQQAVRDDNIVTANGSAALEFAREVLIALSIADETKITEWYDFYKQGFYKAKMPSL